MLYAIKVLLLNLWILHSGHSIWNLQIFTTFSVHLLFSLKIQIQNKNWLKKVFKNKNVSILSHLVFCVQACCCCLFFTLVFVLKCVAQIVAPDSFKNQLKFRFIFHSMCDINFQPLPQISVWNKTTWKWGNRMPFKLIYKSI